jgi:hypothetical protein
MLTAITFEEVRGVQVMFNGANGVPDSSADEYPAVWLQLQVRRPAHLPAFVAAIPSVISHAKSFPGMVRFGFDIDWGRARFRTFGAFDTQASLRAYIGDGAHGAIYRRLHGRLGDTCVTYGAIAGRALPSTWDDIPEARFTKNQVLQGK